MAEHFTAPMLQRANADFVTDRLAVGGDLDYDDTNATEQAVELIVQGGITHILDVRWEADARTSGRRPRFNDTLGATVATRRAPSPHTTTHPVDVDAIRRHVRVDVEVDGPADVDAELHSEPEHRRVVGIDVPRALRRAGKTVSATIAFAGDVPELAAAATSYDAPSTPATATASTKRHNNIEQPTRCRSAHLFSCPLVHPTARTSRDGTHARQVLRLRPFPGHAEHVVCYWAARFRDEAWSTVS